MKAHGQRGPLREEGFSNRISVNSQVHGFAYSNVTERVVRVITWRDREGFTLFLTDSYLPGTIVVLARKDVEEVESGECATGNFKSPLFHLGQQITWNI